VLKEIDVQRIIRLIKYLKYTQITVLEQFQTVSRIHGKIYAFKCRTQLLVKSLIDFNRSDKRQKHLQA